MKKQETSQNKRVYEVPICDVVEFNSSDVIHTSSDRWDITISPPMASEEEADN